MHLHFERTVNAKSDCPILSLTWMGKVPDELPEEEGWKLNRTNYYQEGWLASGNVRGIVGVTFTTSHCKKNVEFPLRTNYNLRGHRSEVILVKWNEPYQKLASCDSSGIIFVWIKYEGRWSIELINDRNTPVTHFSWSHDGRMALICYQDGFVLVGSVAGQRYWSSMLNLDATITCGIWTPDDQQVYFGTTSGQIIVMDVHGAMVSQVQLGAEICITSMAWSCEKFKMEETDESNGGVSYSADKNFVLAVSLQNGTIYLLTTFDDVSPIQIHTGLHGPLCMEWSNSREFLAVSGCIVNSTSNGDNFEVVNMLKFYNEQGILLYTTRIPDSSHTRVSTLTWGHNDKRLFLATGTQIHIAWVSKRIASLQLLCRLRIHDLITSETQLSLLPLPSRLRNIIGNLFAQTIRCCVPEASALREFVSRPPVGSVRLHCTMIRHDEENNLSSGTCYTLYLEYLGGLVPLLKGKRISKIRPEFVIFDPQLEYSHHSSSSDSKCSSSSSNSASVSGLLTDSSDSDRDEGCTGSPRMQRRKRKLHHHHHHDRNSYQRTIIEPESSDDLAYMDTLPEQVRLVEVTSNIWGTKFKIHGLAPSVPANLGQVTYKTSLLHLQPRQMTLVMTELRDDFPIGPDPTFQPNLFSEDEEDFQVDEKIKVNRLSIIENCPPIAPMTPRPNKQRCSYVDNESYECGTSSTTECSTSHDEIRPIASANVQLNLRPNQTTTGTQCTSFIGQFGITTNANLSNQRHAISPICCEVSVPALQSPKNAVAPKDIIFDRPPIPTILSFNNDFLTKPNTDDKKKDNVPITFHLEQSKGFCALKNNQNMHISTTPVTKTITSDELKFIDEEHATNLNPSTSKTTIPSTYLIDSMVRSCSVGYLDMVDVHMVPSDASLHLLQKDIPKRLVLVSKKQTTKRNNRTKNETNKNHFIPPLKTCGKSKSLDSSDLFPTIDHVNSIKCKEKVIPEMINKNLSSQDNTSNKTNSKQNALKKVKQKTSDDNKLIRGRDTQRQFNNNNSKHLDKNNKKNDLSLHTQALANLEKLINRLKEDDNNSGTSTNAPRLPRSSPSSPIPSKKGQRPQSASPIRRKLLNSPLLNRKFRKNKNQESSDDEVNASGDEIFNGTNYKDLETFQKSQLRQKLKRGKIEPNGSSCTNHVVPQRREFVMHNKAPMWNESSQVYQLDFGGRVTQESAKNFQIEFRGKQVMQFGRIDGNAYTLDFQYPFSALQAFAVALANVTQRLK